MGKVGILTMFYKTRNYGGCLQAYALTKYLTDRGVNAEQINYKHSKTKGNYKRLLFLSPSIIYEKVTRRISQAIMSLSASNKADLHSILEIRGKAFDDFCKKYVPSSHKVYDTTTINECVDSYDTIIVGSDQVWNEVTESSPYLLKFVIEGKKRISYAASIAQDRLSSYSKKVFKDALSSFDAISVREQEAQMLLQPLTDKKIHWVVDPTLLLTQHEWEEIVSDINIKEKYLFCYFLSYDERLRTVAKDYAKRRNVKIVTLPYLQKRANKADENFGDYILSDVSPADYLALVKNSDAVMTDSFHTTVFSYIFKRKFYVFSRKEGRTNSRIYSFLNLAGATDCFCDTDSKYSLSYIESLNDIDYAKQSTFLDTIKKESVDFIEENIIKSEDKLENTY